MQEAQTLLSEQIQQLGFEQVTQELLLEFGFKFPEQDTDNCSCKKIEEHSPLIKKYPFQQMRQTSLEQYSQLLAQIGKHFPELRTKEKSHSEQKEEFLH